MLHVTIFSGHEGRFRPENRFYLTLFGATELKRPTLAKTLVHRKYTRSQAGRQAEKKQPGVLEQAGIYLPDAQKPGKPFFLTVFGGASIKVPTLAEELIDLQELLTSGEITRDEWASMAYTLDEAASASASFTLFGGFDECELPTEEEEIESLAVQSHLGTITDSARRILQTGVGQKDAERRAIVQRALTAAPQHA